MEEDLKPIIVTGVDVSKCEFLTKTGHCKAHMSIMGIDTNKCECFPNCYFKQLTREKRECAYWKKANDDKNKLLSKLGCPMTTTAKRKVFTLQQQIDTLKEDNEKMSKGYAELTEIVSPYIDDFTGYNEKLGGFDIVLCVKELLGKLAQKEQDYEKIKHTLDIIKEIAENMNNECFYDDFECKDCDMKNGCTYFNKKQILQKISEVENDR